MTLATWADATATWADATATWAYAGVSELTAVFEWSPTTAPGETPVWVDITERVRSGRITRGRQSEFDRTAAGKLVVVVDNRDRTFDPEFNSDARPNKRIRVSVGPGADTVRLFDGFLDALPQSYSGPADATVNLSATDAFKLLARFELDAIYGSVVEADGPWGWWRLADDLPVTVTAIDSSGNDFHGTWKGNPQASSTLLTDGPGGATLDGEADGVVISTGTLPSTPLSIEAWVKTGKYGTNLSLIAGQTHEIGGSNPQFIRDFVLFMDNDTGVANFTARIVGESNITVTGTTVLRDTGPHHVVGTIGTDRRLRLYVDGVQEGGTSAAATGTSLDSSGRLRIGRPPTNNETGAGDTYKCFKGDICEVAVYDRALSGAEVLEHYTAGAAPWANDTTGARVTRVLDLVGWRSADRSIETGASTLGPAPSNVEGASALDHLLAVEQTEQGRFFIDGQGRACFFSRNHETSVAVEATFTDGEIDHLEFDYSESNLVNDCTVTRVGGLPQRAQDAASIAAYWRMSESMSGLLYSTDNEAKAMAEWRVANLAEPTLRPSAVTFKPLINMASLFPRVLARELGDRVSVTKAVDGADIEVDAVIEGITHDFRGGMHWDTSWNLSPLQYGQFGPGGGGGNTYWTLDHPTLSQLDSNNRLGF